MNRTRWLILSIAVNLLLAGAVVRARHSHPAATALPPVSKQVTNRVVRMRPAAVAPAETVIEVTAPFNWAQVESTDYRIYIENLRAIGCPEATIRDIVVADINELFAGRVREMVDAVTGRFWELMLKQQEMEKLVQEKMEFLKSLKLERGEMLKALFNERVDDKMRREDTLAENEVNYRQLADFLPEPRASQFVDLKSRLQSAQMDLAENNDLPQDEVKQKLLQLDEQMEQEIQALLTPEEFAEYKLRDAPGSEARTKLADFDLTEEEMGAIARANAGSNSVHQIQELLGPERFAAYQRAGDPGYQSALDFTDRFDLPAETAASVWAMQQEAQKQARQIRTDRSRPAEERQAILEALQAETQKSIEAALGPAAFKVYLRHETGGWLSSFPHGVQ